MIEPWTPGPWRVVEEQDREHTTGRGPAIAAGDGDPEPDGPNRYVAEVISDNDPESNANARLISLAPEMAELLAKVVREFDQAEAHDLHYSAWGPVARDLLARARGET